jgi:hypothetical protein
MTRMTDERLGGVIKAAAMGHPGQLIKEVSRARSEEARLLTENAEKDATIAALTDALSRTNEARKRCFCYSIRDTGAEGHDDVCTAAISNLRLAGRLP